MTIERIKKCLLNVGIDGDNLGESDNFGEIIPDSIAFITFIIELESEFSIEIPDEFLVSSEILSTLSDLSKTIESLVEGSL